MTAPAHGPSRVRIDGKFFRRGTERFVLRGVTYGGFAPNKAGEPFPEPDLVEADFARIRSLGANTLRTYDLPPPWLMDLAAAADLLVMAGVAWPSHGCFLDSQHTAREARTVVTTAARRLADHPAFLALVLANEIPADVVRWTGTRRMAAFLDELAIAVRAAAPGCLCTYANFPTTEFLQPARLDFVTFNVFLHEERPLAEYLHRLQNLAGDRPLVLGECGADSLREGLEGQAAVVGRCLAAASRAGLAGSVVYAFTDDWYRGGRRIEDWALGITDAERRPKPAFDVVRAAFTGPPAGPPRTPRVSVVVASFNGASTLPACLESLRHLDYPDYEVILIDDGSTDDTTRISAAFPEVRTLRHAVNMGLSTARNLGIRASTGDIVAFTDADCRADPDWLRLLVIGLFELRVAGIGGPNLLPPDDSPLAAAVMASPGGPAHVLLEDGSAEHLPGCNFAFWRWALEGIGGFDPVFRRAGDDVDVCWRILRQGWRLGFAPAAVVWHHRRSTVGDYLRQQAGYGEAEGLLVAKHPERFNAIGGARWQGRIDPPGMSPLFWNRSVVYRGVFATAPYQTLYTPAADGVLPLLTSLEYHAIVALPLVVLALLWPALWPLAATALCVPPALCLLAAARVRLPADRARWWSRPLIAGLHHLQPLVRGAARYQARFNRSTDPRGPEAATPEAALPVPPRGGVLAYWSREHRDRRAWLERMVGALENRCWSHREDTGWGDVDLEVSGSPWAVVTVVTMSEPNQDGSFTLRARLRRRWTLTASVLFWATLAGVALIAGIFRVDWRAWWIPVASQAVIAWFIWSQGRQLEARLVAVLDEVAREWGLSRL